MKLSYIIFTYVLTVMVGKIVSELSECRTFSDINKKFNVIGKIFISGLMFNWIIFQLLVAFFKFVFIILNITFTVELPKILKKLLYKK